MGEQVKIEKPQNLKVLDMTKLMELLKNFNDENDTEIRKCIGETI